jgi:hypothetical protein
LLDRGSPTLQRAPTSKRHLLPRWFERHSSASRPLMDLETLKSLLARLRALEGRTTEIQAPLPGGSEFQRESTRRQVRSAQEELRRMASPNSSTTTAHSVAV